MPNEELDIENLVKEKKKFQRKGNLKEVARISNELGVLYSSLGKFNQAITEHEISLEYYEMESDWLGKANSHRHIGECYSLMDIYEEALKHQHEYLTLASKCKNAVEEQRAYATIGDTHYQYAERHYQEDDETENDKYKEALRKAEDAFVTSLQLCDKLKSFINSKECLEMKARLYMNLGLVYELKSDEIMCYEFFNKAIKISSNLKLYDDLFRCLYNLSGFCLKTKKYAQAMRLASDSISCAITKKDRNSEREGLILKGKIFLQLSDMSAAKRVLQTAYSIKIAHSEDETLKQLLKKVMKILTLNEDIKDVAKSDMKRMWKIYDKIGDISVELECFNYALDAYKNTEKCALALNLENNIKMITIYVSISQTLKDLKRYNEALDYLELELMLRQGDQKQQCKCLISIAELSILAEFDYILIKEKFDKAYSNAQKCKEPKLLAYVIDVYKNWLKKVGQTEEYEIYEALFENICCENNISDKTDLSADVFKEDFEELDSNINANDDDVDDFEDVNIDLEDDLDFIENESDEEINIDHHSAITNKKFDKKNSVGETPLHRACIAGDVRKVKILLKQGHPVNSRDYCGWLPLHEAANHGYVEIVELLLDHGAWLNDRGGDQCQGTSPLHDACSCGNVAVIKVFVSRGANLIMKNDLGKLPIDVLNDYYKETSKFLSGDELKELKDVQTLLTNNTEKQKELHCAKVFTKNQSNIFEYKKSFSINQAGKDKDKKKLKAASFKKDFSKDEDNSIDIANYMDLVNDIELLYDPKTAANAYQKTIKGLKKPPSRMIVKENQRREFIEPALIPETQFIGEEDWLEDDVHSNAYQGNNSSNLHGSTNNRRPKRKNSPNDRIHLQRSFKNIRSSDLVKFDIEDIDERLFSEINIINDCDKTNTEKYNAYDNIKFSKDNYYNDNKVGIGQKNVDKSIVKENRILNKNTKELSLSKKIENNNNLSPSRSCDNNGKNINKSHAAKYIDSSSNFDKNNSYSVSDIISLNESNHSKYYRNNNQNDFSSDKLNDNYANTSNYVKIQQKWMKVRVEDRLVLVPINENQTVAWLANECSNRYYKSYCHLPRLSLFSHEGIPLMPYDTLDGIFFYDQEVIGQVISWSEIPIDIRYADACKHLECTVYSNIRSQLIDSESSGILNLSKKSLQYSQFQPISHTIQSLTSLKELYLQGNKLKDVSFKSLLHNYKYLPYLAVLNFSNNQLTHESLIALLEVLQSSISTIRKPLQSLQILILNENNFGDVSAEPLIKCLNHLPNLSNFYISNCQFTERFFRNEIIFQDTLKTSYLNDLDISENDFQSLNCSNFFNCLNFERLEKLKISSVPSNFRRDFQIYLNSLDKVKFQLLIIDGVITNPDIYS